MHADESRYKEPIPQNVYRGRGGKLNKWLGRGRTTDYNYLLKPTAREEQLIRRGLSALHDFYSIFRPAQDTFLKLNQYSYARERGLSGLASAEAMARAARLADKLRGRSLGAQIVGLGNVAGLSAAARAKAGAKTKAQLKQRDALARLGVLKAGLALRGANLKNIAGLAGNNLAVRLSEESLAQARKDFGTALVDELLTGAGAGLGAYISYKLSEGKKQGG